MIDVVNVIVAMSILLFFQPLLREYYKYRKEIKTRKQCKKCLKTFYRFKREKDLYHGVDMYSHQFFYNTCPHCSVLATKDTYITV